MTDVSDKTRLLKHHQCSFKNCAKRRAAESRRTRPHHRPCCSSPSATTALARPFWHQKQPSDRWSSFAAGKSTWPPRCRPWSRAGWRPRTCETRGQRSHYNSYVISSLVHHLGVQIVARTVQQRVHRGAQRERVVGQRGSAQWGGHGHRGQQTRRF